MNLFKRLRLLSETPGLSGFETGVAAVISEQWAPFVDETAVDRVGNVIATRRGQRPLPAAMARPKLLLVAHMDEIGLMVSQLIDHQGHGFLRVSHIGGLDVRQIYGQLVTVHASRDEGRELPGIVGALPNHMVPSEQRGQAPDVAHLFVDTGQAYADVVRWVSVGDVISFRQPLRKLLGDRVTGKALDNRASVAAVTVALDHIAHRHHLWDIVAVATVQEETSLLGAYTAAHAEAPAAALVLDVAFATGPGGGDAPRFDLGSGPAVGIGVNVHPGILAQLQDTASALEMRINLEPHGRASGTDAMGVQLARAGVPTGVVGAPIRYMHTMVETAARKDIKRTGRLIGEFAVSLDEHFLNGLTAAMLPRHKEASDE